MLLPRMSARIMSTHNIVQCIIRPAKACNINSGAIYSAEKLQPLKFTNNNKFSLDVAFLAVQNVELYIL